MPSHSTPATSVTAAEGIAAQKAALLGTSPPESVHSTGSTVSRRPLSRAYPAANSLLTAMALSTSAGYLDAFTYIGHGHVFASAMTGNLVLLGLNGATLNPRTLAYASPIIAYVVGVFVAHVLMRERVRAVLFGRPHVATLILEILVLAGIGFTPFPLADGVLVPVITVSTAMQNASFRNIGTRTYNSVIMTGNLQNFANLLVAGLFSPTRDKLVEARDLGAVIGSFASGAAIGALMTPRLGSHALALPAGLLILGAILLVLSRDGTGPDR